MNIMRSIAAFIVAALLATDSFGQSLDDFREYLRSEKVLETFDLAKMTTVSENKITFKVPRLAHGAVVIPAELSDSGTEETFYATAPLQLRESVLRSQVLLKAYRQLPGLKLSEAELMSLMPPDRELNEVITRAEKQVSEFDAKSPDKAEAARFALKCKTALDPLDSLFTKSLASDLSSKGLDYECVVAGSYLKVNVNTQPEGGIIKFMPTFDWDYHKFQEKKFGQPPKNPPWVAIPRRATVELAPDATYRFVITWPHVKSPLEFSVLIPMNANNLTFSETGPAIEETSGK